MVPMGPGMGHSVPHQGHGQPPQSGPVANAFSALNTNKAAAVVIYLLDIPILSFYTNTHTHTHIKLEPIFPPLSETKLYS